MYEKLQKITPDREKALKFVKSFSYDDWAAQLRAFLGRGAESMIALEEKEGKYDPIAHKARLEIVYTQWERILEIIHQELPSSDWVERLLDLIDAPKTLDEIGVDGRLLPQIFRATKDIRDKYVLSRLAWDLGILEELLEQ